MESRTLYPPTYQGLSLVSASSTHGSHPSGRAFRILGPDQPLCFVSIGDHVPRCLQVPSGRGQQPPKRFDGISRAAGGKRLLIEDRALASICTVALRKVRIGRLPDPRQVRYQHEAQQTGSRPGRLIVGVGRAATQYTGDPVNRHGEK